MKKISIFLLLCLVSVSSQAITIVLDGTGTNILEVKELLVGSTNYDVSFEQLIPSAALAFGGDLFLGDPTGAQTAAGAIRDAINLTTAVYVESVTYPACWPVDTGADVDCNRNFIIPTSYPTQGPNIGVDGWYVNNGQFGPGFWTAFAGTGDPGQALEFAKFTPSPVPLPPAVFLFGSGIVFLARISRGRRRGGDNTA